MKSLFEYCMHQHREVSVYALKPSWKSQVCSWLLRVVYSQRFTYATQLEQMARKYREASWDARHWQRQYRGVLRAYYATVHGATEITQLEAPKPTEEPGTPGVYFSMSDKEFLEKEVP